MSVAMPSWGQQLEAPHLLALLLFAPVYVVKSRVSVFSNLINFLYVYFVSSYIYFHILVVVILPFEPGSHSLRHPRLHRPLIRHLHPLLSRRPLSLENKDPIMKIRVIRVRCLGLAICFFLNFIRQHALCGHDQND